MEGLCSQKTELFNETPDRKLANGRDFRHRKYKAEMVIIPDYNTAMQHISLVHEGVWMQGGKVPYILNLITRLVEW
jgi:hypothetical protein